MFSRICFILIIAVFFFYTGCDYSRQYVRQDLYYEQLGKIAVLPFNNHSSNSQAGETLTHLFTTELLAREEFNVVSSYELKRKLNLDYPASGEDIIAQTPLSDISKLVGADSVIIGVVTQYQYKKGLREKPIVGIDVKCYLTDNNEVVWACSYTLEELGVLFHQGSRAEAAQKVCRYVVNNFEKKLKKKSK
ncbi:hypothetical protein J7L67_03175 [bacterium]|nr:hypothetical protein [bacterium]